MSNTCAFLLNPTADFQLNVVNFMFLATQYEEKEQKYPLFAKHSIIHIIEPTEILSLDYIYRS